MVDDTDDKLDAVIVLALFQLYADVAVDTLEAGIHALVEKRSPRRWKTPTGWSADKASDATVIVYMKWYDPAYKRAKAEIDELADTDLVTAYDVDLVHFGSSRRWTTW